MNLQDTPKIIQEGYNTQESHHGHKTLPLHGLSIWEFPQEVVEYQGNASTRIDQEAFINQTRGHELCWPYYIFPIRDHHPKLPGKSLTQYYGKPLFMWIVNQISTMPTSLYSPQMNRLSMTRNLMRAWRPHMGPGFSPTGRTLGYFNSLYFRRKSKIVDNISVTMGWDTTTRT